MRQSSIECRDGEQKSVEGRMDWTLQTDRTKEEDHFESNLKPPPAGGNKQYWYHQNPISGSPAYAYSMLLWIMHRR